MDRLEEPPPEPLTKPKKKFLSFEWKAWQIGIIVFFTTTLVVRSSILDWSWIPSDSMSPTIVEGDIILNNKMAYDFRVPFTSWRFSRNDPQRGDIASFRSPENNMGLIKRVIGIPGDTLSMKHGVIFLNGEPMSYHPLPRELFQDAPPRFFDHAQFWEELLDDKPHNIMFIPGAPLILRNIPDITVPEGHYFMLGDNRDFSRDSRMYGFVKRDHFTGKATSVLFSFGVQEKFEPRVDRFFHALR
ncbi:MAG: signal peptidase I [Verrucomicrobiota bacterium]